MKKFFLIGFVLALGIWAADQYTLEENQRDERRNALFFIEVNGSQPNIPDADSGMVKIDARNRNVVHVKGEATWRDFLESHDIGTTQINSTHYCVNINITRCGEGVLALNGEETKINTVIEQGDILVLLIDDEAAEKMENYNSRQLPQRFKEVASAGERA